LGITNILCLSGNHHSLGVSPAAAGAYDLDPIQLLQALKGMRDDGVLIGGERIDAPPALFLGAVAHPFLRPMKLSLIQTAKKVAAGAQFLITGPVWNAEGFAEWIAAVGDAGLCQRTQILASVRPLASVEQAEALQKRHPTAIPQAVVDRIRGASDAGKEGVSICAELAAKVKDTPGVRGLHIVSGGPGEVLTSILGQAGLERA
jgi:methylenetetrahydrofolate reductase (NADPH)